MGTFLGCPIGLLLLYRFPKSKIVFRPNLVVDFARRVDFSTDFDLILIALVELERESALFHLFAKIAKEIIESAQLFVEQVERILAAFDHKTIVLPALNRLVDEGKFNSGWVRCYPAFRDAPACESGLVLSD